MAPAKKKGAKTKRPVVKKAKATAPPARRSARSSGKAVAAPQPAPPPPSAADQRAALAKAHDSALAKAWAGLQVSALQTIDGVGVNFTLVPKPQPHWHLVTRGLASRGAELSLRTPHLKEHLTIPAWAVSLLGTVLKETLAGKPPVLGQVVAMPDAFGPPGASDLRGVAFGPDPILRPIGTVPVLAIVGVTADEIKLVREWSPQGLLEVYARADALMQCDLDRGSMLLRPRTRAAIEERTSREGSSMGTYVARLSSVTTDKTVTTWKLSVDDADAFIALLKGRIGHLRPVRIESATNAVDVMPAEQASLEPTPKGMTLKLTQTAARQMRASLRAVAGTYTVEGLPNLVIAIEAQP